jgi:hypothetical protein
MRQSEAVRAAYEAGLAEGYLAGCAATALVSEALAEIPPKAEAFGGRLRNEPADEMKTPHLDTLRAAGHSVPDAGSHEFERLHRALLAGDEPYREAEAGLAPLDFGSHPGLSDLLAAAPAHVRTDHGGVVAVLGHADLAGMAVADVNLGRERRRPAAVHSVVSRPGAQAPVALRE